MDKLHHVSTHNNYTLLSKDVPLMRNDDSKRSFKCSSCYRQFRNEIFLKKHMLTKHKIQTRNLTEYTSNSTEENSVSHDLNDYLFLKTLLPNNYSYEVLQFKDLLFGRFKAKFQISHIDENGIINWLNDLSHKTKVDYNLISEHISEQNEHQMLFMCKNINYWNENSKCILRYPIKCTSSVLAVIHPMDNELVHLTKATIVMKHKHYHPMNNSTPLALYQSIRDVYSQLITLLLHNHSVSNALHKYKMKIINNLGKKHYLELMDLGVIPNVEFVYDLYDMLIKNSDISTSLYKQMDILLQSVSFYNDRMGTECSTARLIENNIVIAVSIPQKEMANTDTIFVCSTIFDSCKSWFMFSQNDKKIILTGVIVATDDQEYILKAGLVLWKKLRGINIRTVIVEFIHTHTFQSVFSEATIFVSKFHFLLDAWKWLFNNIDKNISNNDLDCYVEFKKMLYSNNVISSRYSDLNFAVGFIEKYPVFKQFMQNIVSANFPFYSLSTIIPCSTISERKLIYHNTESHSIVQMFHYIIYDVNLFYSDFDPNDQRIIFKDVNKFDENENYFIYSCIVDNYSLYLVQSVNSTYFVDMVIGLCSCNLYNMCSPCIHQIFLNKQLSNNAINFSDDIVSLLDVSDIEKEKENEEFKNVLSELKFVNSKIREQLVTDPNYFKVGIESFVSVLKNDLTSNNDLFSACHKLSNFNPHGLCNDQLKMNQS